MASQQSTFKNDRSVEPNQTDDTQEDCCAADNHNLTMLILFGLIQHIFSVQATIYNLIQQSEPAQAFLELWTQFKPDWAELNYSAHRSTHALSLGSLVIACLACFGAHVNELALTTSTLEMIGMFCTSWTQVWRVFCVSGVF